MSNWSITGSWTWNSSQSHSGTYSAYGPISPSGCHYLTLSNFLSMPTNLTPTLKFYKRIDTMSGWNGGKVEASSDGINWVKLNVTPNYNGTKTFDEPCMVNGEACFTGSATSWIQHTADISSFIGNNLKVRFTWAVRWTSIYNGWWIDDVEIGWGSQCTTQNSNLPGSILNTLHLSKSSNNIVLTWNEPGGSCSYNMYGIYRGTFPVNQYNYTFRSCSISNTNYTDENPAESYYYLVVPLNNTYESSYGLDSNTSERPASLNPCRSQHNTTSCN